MDGKPEDMQLEDSAPRRKRHGVIWALLTLAILLMVLAVVVLGITGRTILAPTWAVARVEARVNTLLDRQASVRIGGVDVLVDNGFIPHVRIRDVELLSPNGQQVAFLPDLRTTLHAQPILRGRIEPSSLRIAGARINLHRRADGSLDIAMGDAPALADGGGADSIVGLLKSIDDVFDLPVLRRLDSIRVEELDLRFSDARTGQVWTASGAGLRLRQTSETVAIDTEFSLAEAGRRQATVALNFVTRKKSPEARFTARVTDVSAHDLAAQSAALAWLSALDAPISGSITSGVDANGRIEELAAVLELGAGALQPTPDTRPVVFDKARLGLSFDPEKALLTLSEVVVDSPSLRAKAEGKAWLKDFTGGIPGTLVGQVAISELAADPEGIFADPVVFSQGALDLKLDLDPFRLQLGQLVLIDGERRISAKGDFTAESDGWGVALDVEMNAIESRRLLDLWPVSAVPLTRKWLEENVATSDLFDAKAAFRARPGVEPHFSLGYEYRATDVRILKTLPPVTDGEGYAVINDYSYTLVVDKGHVTAPTGGRVNVAGSVLSIPDLRIKPAPAKIRLRTESDITAALSLLDQPPFEFLSKAGRPVDLAEGRARVDADLALVLAQKIEPQDVAYDVKAELIDVRSDRIAPGHVLAAASLDLTANRDGIGISGPGTVSGVPVTMNWRQSFLPEEKNRSVVEGTVELSQRFLDAFNIRLPEGSVTGTGTGEITLNLEKGKEAALTLTSDLKGLVLSVPPIGWRKSAGQDGEFRLRGRLGTPVSVDRLELTAPGLKVAGKVLLAPDGAFERALFGTAVIGKWFDGQIELAGRGPSQPVAVRVGGGRADMRSATLGGGQGGAPLSLALDRLTISDGIALTRFRGDFTTTGGLAGEFIANVNEGAAIRGLVAPFGERSAYRIRSADAGAVLRSAGIFERGIGGTLDMSMRPAERQGQYDGSVTIDDIRVVDAPVLAGLLDAISVVGLLTQLNGPGILFGKVTGNFRLTPNAVEIREGAAVGPSLGISGEGVYDIGASRVDLRGTVSPLYALNGVGRIFAKKGEGLFGFNYRMAGPAGSPKINVNPLSILTPGMFREIFRSPPPRAPE
ncbi:MAG: AsmA-like C-terminal region-containing protein [Paracoccaceae bacterium]